MSRFERDLARARSTDPAETMRRVADESPWRPERIDERLARLDALHDAGDHSLCQAAYSDEEDNAISCQALRGEQS